MNKIIEQIKITKIERAELEIESLMSKNFLEKLFLELSGALMCP